MPKAKKTLPAIPKPRGRNGGRRPKPEGEKLQQLTVYLNGKLKDEFLSLVPIPTERNRLISDWIKEFIVDGGIVNE